MIQISNKGRSSAISNDPRTWPDEWYDKLNDPDDPGWSGSWNGFFGKAPKANRKILSFMMITFTTHGIIIPIAEMLRDAVLECVLNKEAFNGRIRKQDW